MPKRIEKLTIKDFRGATVPLDIDFDKSRPMVMIFGENGTGKSSIVDALDFVCNQKYGCLEGRSSVKRKIHLPALDKTKNDISITLKFDNKEWIAHHQNADPVTSPSGFPNANILRRSGILKLIDSPPNKRYEELSEFLSVPDIKIKSLKVREEETDKNKIDYDKLISELTLTDNKDVENAKNELIKYEKYKASLAELKVAAEKKQKQQAAVKTLLESIKQKETKNKDDSAILTRLKEYEKIVPAVRKQYTDNILIAVSNEVDRLYQSIHPEEGLGAISLYLKSNVRGSLEYDGEFQGSTGIPPQAYYSDAHLDTLGICMFLALAKHFNDDNTIIILDDVVTSADEAHRERFLNMLHDEAENFCHLVVTTHYRPWRDFYRIGGGPSNKVQFIDLQLWSKRAGIRHYRSRLIIDEIKSMIDNITIENRQNIASKSGILLEGILDQLALRYGLKVPRRPLQHFELGILFDSLAKHKKHLKTIQQNSDGTTKEIEIKPVIDKLETLTFIRNQIGSHWNMDGSLLADSGVKEFAENTIVLCEALTCNICGNLSTRNKSGSFWQCQCGKKQLYPLKMP